MNRSLKNSRLDCRDQSVSALGKILDHVSFETLGSSNKRAVVFVPEEIVKNALSANSLKGSNNVKTWVEKVDIGTRGQIGHIESVSGKQFIQIPGAASKNSVRFVLNPLLD